MNITSSPNLLIRGRWLIQDAQTIIPDGALLVSDGRVARVGRWPALRREFPALPVIGHEGQAIMPGLINAHHHSNGITAQQQGIPDQLLELWLLSLAGRRPASVYLATLLSAARLLRTGVTAVVDVHQGRGSAAAFRDGVSQGLHAYDEAGMRVAYAAGMAESSYLVWGEDKAFLDGLPAEVRALAQQRLPGPDNLSIDDYFAVMAELQTAYAAHERIDVWFGPPGPQWVADNTYQRMAALAEERGVGIQTHLLESLYEKLHGPRAYGMSTVQHLDALGVLSPRFSLAHGVWLSEADLAILAARGTHVSHNPSSNLRLRAGVAPLNGMMAAGVSVALGMDGTTINDDEDMFAEMRLALRLHRTPEIDGPAPAPEEIWQMATEGGARLLQKEGQIGRLAPGYQADVVLLNLDRLLWPWTAPEAPPLPLLLTRAQAGDVDTVLVGGDVVLRGGQPTRFDVAAAAAELAEQLAQNEPSAAARALVDTLMPYVAAHYRGWEHPSLQPYEARNSKQ
ncbi:MAG: amidohydrolase family protein [Anaerolineales bacterium]|nr:amidohydrolase family protein [Anaerolineales bacterium]